MNQGYRPSEIAEVLDIPPSLADDWRMRGYYAFNYRRYRHSIHQSTPGIIIETGFMTSSEDREVIVHDQDRAAAGIVAAVASFPATSDPDR